MPQLPARLHVKALPPCSHVATSHCPSAVICRHVPPVYNHTVCPCTPVLPPPPPFNNPAPRPVVVWWGEGPRGGQGTKTIPPPPPFVQTTPPSLSNRRGLRKPGHVAQETSCIFGERRPLWLPPLIKSTTCVAPQLQGSTSTSLAGDE